MNQELFSVKKVGWMSYSELYPELKSLIGYAYQFCGRTPPGEDEQEKKEESEVQISLLVDTLQIGLNRHLTLEEVKQSFREGLAMQFTSENFGLNNETYSKWLRAFSEKKHRLGPALGSDKNLLLQRTELTQGEKEKIFEDSLSFSLATFRDSGEIVDLGNALYTALWNKGKIRFDRTQWEKYLKQALLHQETELKRERLRLEKLGNARTRDDVNQLKDIAKQINSIDPGNNNIRALARKLALKDYFLSLNNQKP